MGAGRRGFFLLLKSVHEYERRYWIMRAAEKNDELADDNEPKATPGKMRNHDEKMWLHMTGTIFA